MKVYAINLDESDWGYNRDEFFCLNRNKKQTEDLLKRLKVEFPNKNIHMYNKYNKYYFDYHHLKT